MVLAIAAPVFGVVSQPACIFFVGDSGPLQAVRCSFKGDGSKGESSTTCGTCIASSCQQAVDACCASSSCQGDLSYLDGCAGSPDSIACTTLTTGDLFNDSSGNFATLGTCVQQNCSSPCTGSSVSTAGVTCVNLGMGCSCTATSSTPSSTPACDTTTVVSSVGGNGICCAPSDYPSVPGSTCTCAPYACGTDNVGECVCSASPDLIPGGYTSTASCDASAGGVCCIDNTGFCSCTASLSECSGGTMVFECSPGSGASPCGQTEISVGSCSSL